MKIEKLDEGGFFVSDERMNISFFVSCKDAVREVLKNKGYQIGASDDVFMLPEEIRLDEDQRA